MADKWITAIVTALAGLVAVAIIFGGEQCRSINSERNARLLEIQRVYAEKCVPPAILEEGVY